MVILGMKVHLTDNVAAWSESEGSHRECIARAGSKRSEDEATLGA